MCEQTRLEIDVNRWRFQPGTSARPCRVPIWVRLAGWVIDRLSSLHRRFRSSNLTR